MENLRKNYWLYIITGVIITANIATLALLWLHSGGFYKSPAEPPHTNLFEYLSKELKFTPAQQDAYRLLRNEHQKGSRKLQDSIRNAKDALFNMLDQNNTSDKTLAAFSNKAAALNAELDVFTFHHFQKVRGICNADQQKRFDDIIQEALRSIGPQHQNRPPPRP